MPVFVFVVSVRRHACRYCCDITTRVGGPELMTPMFKLDTSSGWSSARSLRALMLAGLGALALTSAPDVRAHHAFAAEFDAEQPLDLEGTVTKVKWVNPHSWLYLDVKGKDGTVTNWGVEFGTPNALEKKGLKRGDLPAGTPVHIKGYRAKNGGPFGYSVTVTLKDGRTIQTGGAQDVPTSPAAKSGG